MILLICPPVGLDLNAQVFWSQLSRCHVAHFPLYPSSSQTFLLSALRCARGLFLVRSMYSRKFLIRYAWQPLWRLYFSDLPQNISQMYSLVKLQECKFTFSLTPSKPQLWKGQTRLTRLPTVCRLATGQLRSRVLEQSCYIVAKVHNVAGDNLDRDDVVSHLIMRPSSVQNRS